MKRVFAGRFVAVGNFQTLGVGFVLCEEPVGTIAGRVDVGGKTKLSERCVFGQ
jgi:hypothetical protein